MDNPIRKIEAADDGRTRVYPETVSSVFEYVYRAAAGVYWNKELRCFESSNPNHWDNWGHREWLMQIISAVNSELGERLILTDETIFDSNILEFEGEIRMAYLESRARSETE